MSQETSIDPIIHWSHIYILPFIVTCSYNIHKSNNNVHVNQFSFITYDNTA